MWSLFRYALQGVRCILCSPDVLRFAQGEVDDMAVSRECWDTWKCIEEHVHELGESGESNHHGLTPFTHLSIRALVRHHLYYQVAFEYFLTGGAMPASFAACLLCSCT